MNGSNLRPEYTDRDVVRTARRYKAVFRTSESLMSSAGRPPTCWPRGTSSAGFRGPWNGAPSPRATAAYCRPPQPPDAAHPQPQDQVPRGVPPFAPSVLGEDVGEYFDLTVSSPYMLLVADVAEKRRRRRPMATRAWVSRTGSTKFAPTSLRLPLRQLRSGPDGASGDQPPLLAADSTPSRKRPAAASSSIPASMSAASQSS